MYTSVGAAVEVLVQKRGFESSLENTVIITEIGISHKKKKTAGKKKRDQ